MIYASPLDTERRALFIDKGEEYPTRETVVEFAINVEDLWKKVNHNDQIIKAMIDTLQVNPGYDFEFYIFGGGLNYMSAPLLLPLYAPNWVKYPEEVLLETIIHELTHRFVSSARDEADVYSTKKYWDFIRTNYNNESIVTQNHLIIYAVLEKIIPQFFTEEQIVGIKYFRDMEDIGYKRACTLVQKKGADLFINEFRDKIIQ